MSGEKGKYYMLKNKKMLDFLKRDKSILEKFRPKLLHEIVLEM